MAVTAKTLTMDTTAKRLDSESAGFAAQGQFAVSNEGAATVYLGPSNVSASSGFPLKAGAVFTVELRAGDALFGIVQAGTAECRVIQVSGN